MTIYSFSSQAIASLLLIPGLLGFNATPEKILAGHKMDLNNRYSVSSVNLVFKDNILLTLNNLEGGTESRAEKVVWNEVIQSKDFSFTLNPGQVFAFHDSILPEFKNRVVKTTESHFSGEEGFKSDGYLFGDGVCHLASLIYWTAKDAGLETVAPTNHNFARINGIPRDYGVSIYSNPLLPNISANQNLYVANNFSLPVSFNFQYQDGILYFSISIPNPTGKSV
ncbi:MAG: VanW family protein [Patescibacteria group bacterium]|nr:VanW family protein [Patescibacteria group bacterium]